MMNNDYLRRGKRLDNREWVTGGYFLHHKRTPCPIGDSIKDEDIVHLIIQSGFSDWNMPRPITVIPIDPATLGRCTGLKDKNGWLIFEGDILGGESELITLRGEPTRRFEESRYLVMWNNERAGFSAKRIFSSQHAKAGLPHAEERPTAMIHITAQYYPCIGNIHDNPELLGEVDT